MSRSHRFFVTLLIAALSLPALAVARQAEEPVDLEMIAKIREEGLERSRVWETFSQYVDVFGPRLTATPAFNEAARWSRDKLQSWGLDDAHLESFPFGRGWTLEHFTLEMVEPRYMPLMGYPRAWSPSTDGELLAKPVMLAGKSETELAEYSGRLRNAIVMMRPEETRFITADRDDPPDYRDTGTEAGSERWSPTSRANVGAAERAQQEAQRAARRQARTEQQAVTRMLRSEAAGVVLEPSRSEHGTLFVLGQSRDDDDAVPTVVMAPEHYNMIVRLVERGIDVKLRVRIDGRFHEDDTNSYNVIAEVPGSDPEVGDEVVMIGAHLDSWHSASGATDNADGSATVMEAMRILQAIGARPRRAIRMALWGGEEQGLHGSRRYVERHLSGDANAAARDKFSVYFNLDPGAGPINGFFVEGNPAVIPFFAANLAPFQDLRETTLTMGRHSCTDHFSFIAEGLPGFQPIHSFDDYDVRTHHTNVDSYERIREEDLMQASVVMASLLYHAAMRDEKIPRAPAVGSGR